MTFQLPKLAYSYDALEPYIDARTMEIHYSKHHAAYMNNLNKLLDGAGIQSNDAIKLLVNLDTLPESIRTGVRNNGGGYVNHTLFWEIMWPNCGCEPVGDLGDAIRKTFGSFASFKENFTDAATRLFGSGWVWLSVKEGKLVMSSTQNHNSPISEGAVPILVLDVWEHAYYLKYQNRRPEYIDQWWNVVNWKIVADKYLNAFK